jgi:ketosteroid isomerase-like protein
VSPADLVDRYLAAVSAPGTPPAMLAELLHPDYVFREWPNAINPAGSERDRATSLDSFAASRKLLAASGFEVHDHVVHGDTVASRLTWRGRLAVGAGPLKAGMELTAHVSQHTIVRERLIWRTESFDCYEPLPTTDQDV